MRRRKEPAAARSATAAAPSVIGPASPADIAQLMLVFGAR